MHDWVLFARKDADNSQLSWLTRFLLLAQGAYYLVTGIWPLLSIRTFQMVTGPKTDLWLVKTVGAIVGVIGAVLGLAGSRHRISPELRLLAAGSAVSLTVVDVVYVAKRRIAPIYLLDAAAEVLLLIGWLAAPFTEAIDK